ncbi:ABC transporter substrate-binding protein [Actinomadura syzygii]|uniref:ABC transporter substrate-binding protein n=1 Tax=Actinomadura syzygii TaxID=1427538 RepID=UPI00165225C6|nr:ABC transporter substrate-binding protein [Actinomadura syzygii]
MSGTPSRPRARLRRFVVACAAATLALTLVACGSPGDDATSQATGTSARTVQTPDGPVQIPAKPKRIIGLSYAAAWLLDAGVSMVGVTDIDENALTEQQRAQIKKVPLVGEGNELNLEKIVSLWPDLIVISAPKRVTFPIDKLKPIAPVLSYGIGDPDELLPTSLKVDDAAGRAAAGEQTKKTYTDKLAELKAKYADKLTGKKWAIVNSGEAGKFSVYTASSWLGIVLKDLGVTWAPVKGVDGGDFSFDKSFEEIGTLAAADVILVDGDEPGGSPSAETATLLGQQNWKALKAARDGQVHPIRGFFTSRYQEAVRILGDIESFLPSL